MKMIVIEDCNGLIGLADTLEHAIDFLMDEDLLNEGTPIPVFDKETKEWNFVSVTERFGEHWGNTLRSAKSCDELNDAFSEDFFFYERDVYTGGD